MPIGIVGDDGGGTLAINSAIRACVRFKVVKTTQNSTGGTGTHSAGKLTKTEVSGKEDKECMREGRGQAPFIFLLPNLCFITGC
jgi:hypothetical protein